MKINLKAVYRFVSIVLVIFFFVPAFTVSCSGQSVSVSGAHSIIGYSVDGSKIADGNILTILLLAFAVVILLATLMSGKSVKQVSAISLLAAVADLIGWLVFQSKVKDYAENNMCEFKAGFGFYINIICIVVVIAAAAGDMLNMIQDSDEVANSVKPGGWQCPNCGTQLTINDKFCAKCGAKKVETAMPVIAGGWICPGCGSTMKNEDKFCAKCGGSKPAQSNETPAVAEPVDDHKCKNCGAQLEEDSAFCASCGTKVE